MQTDESEVPTVLNTAEMVEWLDGRLRNEGTPIDVQVLHRIVDLEQVFRFQTAQQ